MIATESAELALLRSALGDDVVALMHDERVSDILVRPWGVSIDCFDEGLCGTGIVPRAGQIEAALRVVSGLVGGSVGEREPIVECKLPIGGCRFAGILYGEGESFYTVRRHRALPVALDDYARKDGHQEGYGRDSTEALDDGHPSAVAVLRALIRRRTSLLINGPTGSGKTTLLQACLSEAAAQQSDAHFLIIEDTPELRCDALHRTFMRTTAHLAIRDLARAALRHRPSWQIYGEVRGAEALDVVNAAISGHPTMFTVHAQSGVAALNRLAAAIGEAVVTVDRERIVDAVGALVAVRRRGGAGREHFAITEILAVDDLVGGRWQVRSLLGDAA